MHQSIFSIKTASYPTADLQQQGNSTSRVSFMGSQVNGGTSSNNLVLIDLSFIRRAPRKAVLGSREHIPSFAR